MYGAFIQAEKQIYREIEGVKQKKLCLVKLSEHEPMKIVVEFLKGSKLRSELRHAILRFKSTEFLTQQFGRIFMTRMLRKKYVYNAAKNEVGILLDFYRDMNNKRGRGIVSKLDGIQQQVLEAYLDDFIDMKRVEYFIEYNRYSITQITNKITF